MNAQHDLFERASAVEAVDRDFTGARRFALDAHSWVEVVPGWLSGDDALLERLVAHAPWEQRDRRLFDQVFQEPRLTCEYRDVHDAGEEVLVEAVRALSRRYAVAYDGLWVNYYRDGRDSTAWHRDRFDDRRNKTVPVLTLGATRRFLIKPRDGGKSWVFRPTSGDLIVMGGQAQDEWVHSVPKEADVAGRRISINFQSSSQG